MHVESQSVDVGQDATKSQRRQPKHKRQQKERRSALAPTPIPTRLLLYSKEGRPLPSDLNPTGPPARAVDSLRCSYIHGTPDGIDVPGVVHGSCASDFVELVAPLNPLVH